MIDSFGRPSSSAPGDTAAEGDSGAAARANHRHAREAADANLTSTAGDISQVDSGDAASAGALTTGARADHQHAVPTPAAASTSAVADSATAGSSTKLAREDHKHGREAFATPVAIGSSNSAGSAATIPHSDHVHGTPNGHQVVENFSGGPKLESGTASDLSFSASQDATVTLTFPVAFGAAPIVIAGLVSGSGATGGVLRVDTITASSCRVVGRATTSITASWTYNWIAIGT